MTKTAKKARCPQCKQVIGKQGVGDKATTFPFCSERCRLVDFGAWANESYVVAGPMALETISSETTPPDSTNLDAQQAALEALQNKTLH